jgi:homeobox protein cut-like
MGEVQATSAATRKALADATKTFKQGPQEVTVSVGPLLKSYQSAIDELTRRSRFSEDAFLALYKALYEASDPVAALRGGVEAQASLAQAQAESQALRTEVAQYAAEFADLKSQHLTLRGLQDKLAAYDASMEARVADALEARAVALAVENQAAAAAWAEREGVLSAALQAARLEAHAARRAADAAESALFEARGAADEAAAAHAREIEAASEEVVHAAASAAAALRESELLRARVLRANDCGSAEGRDSVAFAAPASPGIDTAPHARAPHDSDEAAAAVTASMADAALRLRDELAAAKTETAALDAKLLRAADASARALSAHETSVATAAAEIQRLKAALAAAPTRVELERLQVEVRALRALEFNCHDPEEEGCTLSVLDEGEVGGAGALQRNLSPLSPSGRGESKLSRVSSSAVMDHVLTRKILHLQTELTKAKRKEDEAEASAAVTRNTLASTLSALAAQTALTTRLDADLAIALAAAQPASLSSSPSVTRPTRSLAAVDDATGTGSGAVASRCAVGDTDTAAASTLAPAPASCCAGSGSDGLLPVLRGQRDRLSARVSELEVQLEAAVRHSADSAASADQLRADNIRLFEKLKYVQSFKASDNAAAKADSGGVLGPDDLERADETSYATEARYRRIYETGCVCARGRACGWGLWVGSFARF